MEDGIRATEQPVWFVEFSYQIGRLLIRQEDIPQAIPFFDFAARHVAPERRGYCHALLGELYKLLGAQEDARAISWPPRRRTALARRLPGTHDHPARPRPGRSAEAADRRRQASARQRSHPHRPRLPVLGAEPPRRRPGGFARVETLLAAGEPEFLPPASIANTRCTTPPPATAPAAGKSRSPARSLPQTLPRVR